MKNQIQKEEKKKKNISPQTIRKGSFSKDEACDLLP